MKRHPISKSEQDCERDSHGPGTAIFAYRSPAPRRRFLIQGGLGAIFAFLLIGANAVHAADPGALLAPGDAVVTGFSGTASFDGVARVSTGSSDDLFINLDGPSMQILQLQANGGRANGQLLPAPAKFQVMAGQIGQVFGIALDDGSLGENQAVNIYLAASSAFGIKIVQGGVDGAGKPVRIRNGAPGAEFMPGQFGTYSNGGPGSVWKVDGLTGEVTLFADVALEGESNSGPGLGNIAFDKERRQFYVSDLDTGMIHRLSASGEVIDAFDHGVMGRPSEGMPQVFDEVADRMNIEDPAFDAENSETWGLTAPERRVWGLAAYRERLYYAVWDGPQIWSVGINQDGSFADDARKEFDVATDGPAFPVSDIAFDEQGRLYVAQRGGLTSREDYSILAEAGSSKVMRFIVANGDEPQGEWIWNPLAEEYAIGMAPDYMNASGGVAIGHDATGASCNTLWSTGDNLLHEVSASGSIVHGLQGNDLELVRPQNEPPLQAVFADYDEKPGDPAEEGHVGDVEVLRLCASGPSGWVPPIETHSKYRSHWKHASHGHSKWRSHWKSASHGHSKTRSHWKSGSNVHSKYRSHWKYGSYEHTKERSHWKHASRDHSKERSHWKHASRDHSKWRSHWKHASRDHSKERSHWKTASRDHSKERSHWKHASRDHSKERSHWKTASRDHSKERSHWKHASNDHSKLKSHWKSGSNDHSKLKSHWKNGSNDHSKERSHWKSGSNDHSKLKSHWKSGSNDHSKLKSHWKSGSNDHSKSKSHWKSGSNDHSKSKSHNKSGSNQHSKLKSHWKSGSNDHSKSKSHSKNGSSGHSKSKSHNKSGSNQHSKLKSHWKSGSNVHSKSKSHSKIGSSGHSKSLSHNKHGSNSHSKQKSHNKLGSSIVRPLRNKEKNQPR